MTDFSARRRMNHRIERRIGSNAENRTIQVMREKRIGTRSLLLTCIGTIEATCPGRSR
jgi:hypothetical protein